MCLICHPALDYHPRGQKCCKLPAEITDSQCYQTLLLWATLFCLIDVEAVNIHWQYWPLSSLVSRGQSTLMCCISSMSVISDVSSPTLHRVASLQRSSHNDMLFIIIIIIIIIMTGLTWCKHKHCNAMEHSQKWTLMSRRNVPEVNQNRRNNGKGGLQWPPEWWQRRRRRVFMQQGISLRLGALWFFCSSAPYRYSLCTYVFQAGVVATGKALSPSVDAM